MILAQEPGAFARFLQQVVPSFVAQMVGLVAGALALGIGLGIVGSDTEALRMSPLFLLIGVQGSIAGWVVLVLPLLLLAERFRFAHRYPPMLLGYGIAGLVAMVVLLRSIGDEEAWQPVHLWFLGAGLVHGLVSGWMQTAVRWRQDALGAAAKGDEAQGAA